MQQWNAEIGIFICKCVFRIYNYFKNTVHTKLFFSTVFLYFFKIMMALRKTLGKKENCSKSLYFCHWNIYGLSAQNFVNLSSFQVYNGIYKQDVIYYLDNSVSSDDRDLYFPGYKMERADCSGSTKRKTISI